MTEYPWICPACKATTPAGSKACLRCGCPEDASPAVADDYIRTYTAAEMPQSARYACPKCSHTNWTTGEFRAAGGTASALFDVATVRFRSVSCQRCGFTEFYRSDLSAGNQLVD